MEKIEEALITFCERKESLNETLYLSDIIKFLKECWEYSLDESLGLIEDCIAEKHLEIKSIAGLYDIDGRDDIKEVISDRIKKCCSRSYGFGIYHQIENLNNEERRTIDDITNFILKIIIQKKKKK